MITHDPDDGGEATAPPAVSASPPARRPKVPRELALLGLGIDGVPVTLNAENGTSDPTNRRRAKVSYTEPKPEEFDDFGDEDGEDEVGRGSSRSGRDRERRARTAPQRLSPGRDDQSASRRESRQRQQQLRAREEEEAKERVRRANSQYSLRNRGGAGGDDKEEEGEQEQDQERDGDSPPRRKLIRKRRNEDDGDESFEDDGDQEDEEEEEEGEDEEDDGIEQVQSRNGRGNARSSSRAPDPLDMPLEDAPDAPSDDMIEYSSVRRRKPTVSIWHNDYSDDEADELTRGTPGLHHGRVSFPNRGLRNSIQAGDLSDSEEDDEDDGAQPRRELRPRRQPSKRKRDVAEEEDADQPVTKRASRNSRAERYARRAQATATTGDEAEADENGEEVGNYKLRERKTRVNYKQLTAADIKREWERGERRTMNGDRDRGGRDRDRERHDDRDRRRGGGGRERSAASYLKKGIAAFFEAPRRRDRNGSPDSSDDDRRGGRFAAGGGSSSSGAAPPMPINLSELVADPSRSALAVSRGKNLADIDPLPPVPPTTFQHLGGLDDQIRGLKEMVLLPLMYPEVYENLGVQPPRGVLFHGPPGTGKTMLARALANSCSNSTTRIAFFMRKGSDCLSKWVGEAERQLRLLFDEAKAWQPSIIFFDEIDGLAPVRSAKQDQVHSSIVSTLLALMDGLDSRGQVVVIGATNRIDAVDPALRRPGRFDREFLFTLPSVAARRKIIDVATATWSPPLDESVKERLAEATQGYAGADVKALCTEAALHAVRTRWPQIYESGEKLLIEPKDVQVGMEDFLSSMKRIVPSTYRHSPAASRPLPAPIEPLLKPAIESAVAILDKVAPVGTEERRAEWIQRSFPDAAQTRRDIAWPEEGGHGRAALSSLVGDARFPFASSSYTLPGLTYRQALKPRLLICGPSGMGQSSYVGPAVCERMESWRYFVQSVDLAGLVGDPGRSPESAIAALFHELRRQKPSVAYIPNIDAWWLSLPPIARTAFVDLLNAAMDPHDPIVLVATCEKETADMPRDLMGNVFGWWGGKADRGIVRVLPPDGTARQAYFTEIFEEITRPPPAKAFPIRSVDGTVLGHVPSISLNAKPAAPLPLAPPPPPREMTKDEKAAMAKHDLFILSELRRELRTMTQEISRNRQFKDFSRPLDPIEDLVEAIKTPMNLLIVFEKINAGEYWTPDEWLEDLQLIVDNWEVYAAEKGIPRKDALDVHTRACDMVDLAHNMVYNMNPELLAECAQTAERMEAEAGQPKEKERQRREKERVDRQKRREEKRQSRRIRGEAPQEPEKDVPAITVDLTEDAAAEQADGGQEAGAAEADAGPAENGNGMQVDSVQPAAPEPETDDLLFDGPGGKKQVNGVVDDDIEDDEEEQGTSRQIALEPVVEGPSEAGAPELAEPEIPSEAIDNVASETPQPMDEDGELEQLATQFFNAGEEIEEDVVEEGEVRRPTGSQNSGAAAMENVEEQEAGPVEPEQPINDDHLAISAPPDAQLVIDMTLLERLRRQLIDGTDGFSIEELELLSADMCTVINARRLDWDRSGMIEELMALVDDASASHQGRMKWLAEQRAQEEPEEA